MDTRNRVEFTFEPRSRMHGNISDDQASMQGSLLLFSPRSFVSSAPVSDTTFAVPRGSSRSMDLAARLQPSNRFRSRPRNPVEPRRDTQKSPELRPFLPSPFLSFSPFFPYFPKSLFVFDSADVSYSSSNARRVSRRATRTIEDRRKRFHVAVAMDRDACAHADTRTQTHAHAHAHLHADTRAYTRRRRAIEERIKESSKSFSSLLVSDLIRSM